MQISIAKPPQFAVFTTADMANLNQMADLCLSHNFSPAIFKDGKRSLANFEKAYCIGLDIDNDGKLKPGGQVATPKMTIDEAKEIFKDYTHLILPSRSHQKEKDGVVCDRFRVILFFSEPITDLDTFYATWHWCETQWPAIDHQCKDPSRGYFAHSAVASVRGGGLRIKPVPPAPKEPTKGNVDLSLVPPGSHGKLSRTTLELLAIGAEKGNRNGSVYKAAKDFQQNLYSLDETTAQIVAALERTDTLTCDFPRAEAELAIRSAFNTDAKHDPRIKPRAFNLVQVGELYKTKSELAWVVDRLLSVGGLSIISADPKAGKSTLVRQLMRDVLRGGAFLDRQCKQGSVHYYAIEEQIEVVNMAFKRLGVDAKDNLLVHVGDPLTDNKMQDFAEILAEQKPILAVIDTMFDFIDVESENNYKEVKRELRRLRRIARDTDTHILLVHHTGKSSKGDNRYGSQRILGSTAIAGGVDTTITVSVVGRRRLVNTSGREVETWTQRNLIYDFKAGTYSLGPEEEEF